MMEMKRPRLGFGTKALILSTVTGVLVFVFDNSKSLDGKFLNKRFMVSLTNQYHLSLKPTDLTMGKKVTLLVSAIMIGLLIVSDDYDEIDDYSIDDARPNAFDHEYERWMYYALDPDGNLCAPGA